MNWGRVRSMDFSIYNVRRRVDEYYHLFEGKNKSANNEQNIYRFSSTRDISSFIIDTDFFHIVIKSDSDKPFGFRENMKVSIIGSFYGMFYLKKNGNYIDTEKDFFLSDIRMRDEYKDLFHPIEESLNYVDYIQGNNKGSSVVFGFRSEGSENRADTSITFLPIGEKCSACLRIEEIELGKS